MHMVASPMAFPSSHVVVKTVGDPFTLQWGARNDGQQAGYVRLVVYEVLPSGAVLRGGTPWTAIQPGQTMPLNASGATNTAWTQQESLAASLRIEASNSLADVAAGRVFLVDRHDFTLTVNPGVQAPSLGVQGTLTIA